MDKLSQSVEYLNSRISARPRSAVVLGSGLGDFARKLTNKTVIDSSAIPHYPVPQVEGHAGQLIFGRVPSSKSSSLILAFVGRPHFYESADLDRVTYPIRLAHRLGVKNLILTNAAGGVNPEFSPGDLMLITGQINLTLSALKSPKELRSGMQVYNSELLELARESAGEKGVDLKEGVYCGVTGPSYETAAEIEMVRRIGADAVGMSTVHEAMIASRLGIKVLGISLITNLATGLTSEPASHEEVIRVAREARKRFERFLLSMLSNLT